MNHSVKQWLWGEYVALKKDFGAGTLLILTIGVAVLIVEIITKVMNPIVSLLSDNYFIKIGLSILIVILLGLVTRKLKENKKTEWIVDFLPQKTMDKKEVIYWHEGNYCSGILLGYRDIPRVQGDTIRCAAIARVNAGPTSITLISPYYIPVSEDLKETGRTMKDVVKELATLGAITKEDC